MSKIIILSLVVCVWVSLSQLEIHSNNIENSAIVQDSIKHALVVDLQPQIDSEKIWQTDTFKTGNNIFVLQVIKLIQGEKIKANWFIVKKKTNKEYKIILKDRDYGTNNSGLFVKDNNNDGYLDIVWDKKWQEHAYLYNPKIENFIEVGECHNLDTLKVNGQAMYYKEYPLLFYTNSEKGLYKYGEDEPWIIELHSELFIIDSNYQKISFAVLDNFASLGDRNIKMCEKDNTGIINCFVPPYRGLYSKFSIWNIGKSVDSFKMKNVEFDEKFIKKYWQNKYQELLVFGQKFKVRREHKLEYY